MKATLNRNRNASENPYLPKAESERPPLIAKAAQLLQRKAEKLSSQNKWLGLVLFCLLSIGCSVGVIMYSVSTCPSFFSIESIRLPVPPARPHRLPRSEDSIITTVQYERIQKIESYLSQQKNHPSTRTFYDSLLKARPLFLDSLRTIDSLFLSQ